MEFPVLHDEFATPHCLARQLHEGEHHCLLSSSSDDTCRPKTFQSTNAPFFSPQGSVAVELMGRVGRIPEFATPTSTGAHLRVFFSFFPLTAPRPLNFSRGNRKDFLFRLTIVSGASRFLRFLCTLFSVVTQRLSLNFGRGNRKIFLLRLNYFSGATSFLTL